MTPEEVTRLWQRIIELERLVKLLGEELKTANANKQAIDTDLEQRLKILEEARKIQIKLNANIPVKIEPKIEAKIDVNSWLSKFLKK